jgi:hypothetical protein
MHRMWEIVLLEKVYDMYVTKCDASLSGKRGILFCFAWTVCVTLTRQIRAKVGRARCISSREKTSRGRVVISELITRCESSQQLEGGEGGGGNLVLLLKKLVRIFLYNSSEFQLCSLKLNVDTNRPGKSRVNCLKWKQNYLPRRQDIN